MNDDGDKSIKTHSEIIDMIDELRTIEGSSEDFIINKSELKEDIYEVKFKISDKEDENLENKKKFLFNFKKYFSITKSQEKEILNPTTFNIGFNKEGKFVNLDFKEEKNRDKQKFQFKNLIKLKKGKKIKNIKSEDKKGKFKGKISKIGKLKKVIPSKKKNKDKPKDERSD